MKSLFLLLVVCTLIFNAGSLSILQPAKQMSLLEKLKADPEAFVSEMSEADPLIVEQVLALLNGLLETSETREGVLVDHLDKKKKALDDANARVVAAQAVVAQAVKDQQAANAAVAGADAAVTAANLDLTTQQTAQAQAQTEKNDSQKGHDNEINGLNDDQSILRQVIELLTQFLTSSPTQSPTASPTTQSPTASPTIQPPTMQSQTVCSTDNGPDDSDGWKLVRRVKAGGTWHPSTDQLVGTDDYGTFLNDPQADSTFSRRFDHEQFDQFLFITGDCEKWLIATKEMVIGEFYSNSLRQIVSSSKSLSASEARWYRRQGVLEDPWISTIDHGPARLELEVVYGGAADHQFSGILSGHNGANVFIRSD